MNQWFQLFHKKHIAIQLFLSNLQPELFVSWFWFCCFTGNLKQILSRSFCVEFWLVFKLLNIWISSNMRPSLSCLSIFAENVVWYLSIYWIINREWIVAIYLNLSLTYLISVSKLFGLISEIELAWLVWWPSKVTINPICNDLSVEWNVLTIFLTSSLLSFLTFCSIVSPALCLSGLGSYIFRFTFKRFLE